MVYVIVKGSPRIYKEKFSKVKRIYKHGNEYVIEVEGEPQDVIVGKFYKTNIKNIERLTIFGYEKVYENGKFSKDIPLEYVETVVKDSDEDSNEEHDDHAYDVFVPSYIDNDLGLSSGIFYTNGKLIVTNDKKMDYLVVLPIYIRNIYVDDNNDIFFEVEIHNKTFKIKLLGRLEEIIREIYSRALTPLDRKTFERYMIRFLSYYLKEYDNVSRIYSTIGVIPENGHFKFIYPSTAKILSKNDEQKVILNKFSKYSLDPEPSTYEIFVKYIKKHHFGFIANVITSYIAVSPIFYTTHYLDVRPDMIVIGPHGTSKTKTLELITDKFYGAIIETGEFFNSISRAGDVMSSMSFPVIVDEIENVGAKDLFSLLKARTTTHIDFVRKRPDQTQIRQKLLTPLVMISNRRDILKDEHYIKGRTILIDVGIFNKDKSFIPSQTPKEFNELVMKREILGKQFWDFVSENYGTDGIREMLIDDSYILRIQKQFVDVRRPTIYNIIRTGLILLDEFFKDNSSKYKFYKKREFKKWVSQEEQLLKNIYEIIKEN